MKHPEPYFAAPGLIARAVNHLYGQLVSVGLGLSDSFLLLTNGRNSGMTHATPVNVLRHNGKLYLVGTRGHTQWSRNALVAGTVTLKRGRIRIDFRLRVVPEHEKPEVLKAYLNRFNWMVSRFFSVPGESAVDAFAAIAPHHPVIELLAEK